MPSFVKKGTSCTTSIRNDGFHRPLSESRRVRSCATPTSSSPTTQHREELPKTTSQQVELAAKSVKRALESGKKNLEVTFDIPLIGATDLDDWPGGETTVREYESHGRSAYEDGERRKDSGEESHRRRRRCG